MVEGHAVTDLDVFAEQFGERIDGEPIPERPMLMTPEQVREEMGLVGRPVRSVEVTVVTATHEAGFEVELPGTFFVDGVEVRLS